MKALNLPKEKPEVQPPAKPLEPSPLPEINPVPEREEEPGTLPEIPVPSPEPFPLPEKM